MKRLMIHYFTGTGNTEYAVRLIGDKMKSDGYLVEYTKIEKGTIPPDGNYDLQVIAFPVYALSAPVMVKRYAVNFKESIEKNQVSILAISGALVIGNKIIHGDNGSALETIEKIMKKKNYDVFLTEDISLPQNWTQFVNPLTPGQSKLVFDSSGTIFDGYVDKLKNRQKNLYRANKATRIIAKVMSLLFGMLGRRFLGKLYIADNKCNACGLCAGSCPAKTIRMIAGIPVWKLNCEDCNKCINICPKAAIQLSFPKIIIHIILNFSVIILMFYFTFKFIPAFMFFDFTPLLITMEILTSLVLIFIFSVLQLYIVELLFYVLQKIPFIRSFLSLSITNGYRRYTAYKYKPGNNI
jgi:ferredoxin